MGINRLPGIMRLSYIKCKRLPAFAMFESLNRVIISVPFPTNTIHFYGEATLSWEGSMLNGQRQEKSTLEFKTSDELPMDEPIAFVVTTIYGLQYLIGTREPNYPVINYSDSTGTVGKDAAVRTYKVTHLGRKSVLRCIL